MALLVDSASAKSRDISGGTIFAVKIRRNRVQAMRSFHHPCWHLDDVFVKINGVKHALWRVVDHQDNVFYKTWCASRGFARMPTGGTLAL